MLLFFLGGSAVFKKNIKRSRGSWQDFAIEKYQGRQNDAGPYLCHRAVWPTITRDFLTLGHSKNKVSKNNLNFLPLRIEVEHLKEQEFGFFGVDLAVLDSKDVRMKILSLKKKETGWFHTVAIRSTEGTFLANPWFSWELLVDWTLRSCAKLYVFLVVLSRAKKKKTGGNL